MSIIEWRDVQLNDKEQIDKLICAGNCHNADYSFANLYIWRHAYKPMIAIVGGRLIVGNPQWDMYAYPKGDGDLRQSIDLILEDAHARGNKAVIRGLTDRMLEEFLPIYGDRFELSEDRDNADYLYTADKLCNLAGRKLSAKRNHINKFERNGDWEFVRITDDNMDAAKDFVAEFYKEKGDPDLESEAIAIAEMFANYHELGFMGGLLYQNGRPVAFSAGTLLDPECVDVHFEKALPDIEGAYTMINREFARMVVAEHPSVEYFNREEDMGLEGLRKAKLSYHPDVLLMKYYAKEK